MVLGILCCFLSCFASASSVRLLEDRHSHNGEDCSVSDATFESLTAPAENEGNSVCEMGFKGAIWVGPNAGKEDRVLSVINCNFYSCLAGRGGGIYFRGMTVIIQKREIVLLARMDLLLISF
jgi:hypothetical protein